MKSFLKHGFNCQCSDCTGGMEFVKSAALIVIFLLLCLVPSHAQTTAVTATITDSTGQAWSNGTYTITFVPNPQFPGIYTYQGVQFSPQIYKGSFNSAGTLSITLPDNAYITPSGSKWLFVLCANTSAPCSQMTRTVTGASESFTADFSSNVTAPIFPIGLIAYGYKDSEIYPTPLPGGFYYNVTIGCQRVWNGSSWACSNGSSGSGCQLTGIANGDVLSIQGGECYGDSSFTYNSAKGVVVTTLSSDDTRFGDFPFIDPSYYGGAGDGLTLNNCSIAIGTHTLVCNDNHTPVRTFSSTGILDPSGNPKLILVFYAGTSDNWGSALITTIAAYVSPTTVTLTDPAVQTATNAPIQYGTDNAVPFCNATHCTQASYTGLSFSGIDTGRELYIPGGTWMSSQSLYVRGNMIVHGAGQAATQLVLESHANALTTAAEPDWNTANINPVICLNGNATAGPNTCTTDSFSVSTGSNGVYDMLVTNAGEATVGVLATNYGGGLGGSTYIENVWTDSNYSVVLNNVTLSTISKLTCDFNSTICVLIHGPNNEPGSGTWNIHVSDSFMFESFIGVWIDGTADVTIDNVIGEFVRSAGVFVYSPTGLSTYRLTVSNSTFLGPVAATYPIAQHVAIDSPCVDCAFSHNRFYGSPSNDLALLNAVYNLKLSNNLFAGALGSSIIVASPLAGNVIADSNTFDTPGYYGVQSSGIVWKFTNNVCVNPFLTTAPSSNAWQQGCFYFTTGSSGTEARANSVTSSGTTKYPALSFDTIAEDTSDTRSDSSGCSVCVNSNATGASLTFNEFATNYGTSGRFLFSPIFGAGGFNSNIYELNGGIAGEITTGGGAGSQMSVIIGNGDNSGLPGYSILDTHGAGTSILDIYGSTNATPFEVIWRTLSYYTGAVQFGSTVQINNEATYSGYAACYSTSGQMGHCTSVVGATGLCTCVSP